MTPECRRGQLRRPMVGGVCAVLFLSPMIGAVAQGRSDCGTRLNASRTSAHARWDSLESLAGRYLSPVIAAIDSMDSADGTEQQWRAAGAWFSDELSREARSAGLPEPQSRALAASLVLVMSNRAGAFASRQREIAALVYDQLDLPPPMLGPALGDPSVSWMTRRLALTALGEISPIASDLLPDIANAACLGILRADAMSNAMRWAPPISAAVLGEDEDEVLTTALAILVLRECHGAPRAELDQLLGESPTMRRQVAEVRRTTCL